MPLTTKFVEDGHGVVFQGSGLLTEDELTVARMVFKSDAKAMQCVAYVLFDFKNVVEMRLDYNGIRRLIGIDKDLAKLAPDIAVAIVATTDQTFGMARMWKTMAEETGWPIVVVRSPSEAHAWLAETLIRRAPASAILTDVCAVPVKTKERRSDSRIKLGQALRIRPAGLQDPIEIVSTLNVSALGLYFVTFLEHYYPNMEVRVTRNFRRDDPTNCEDAGVVVRVDKLRNGKRGIAIRIVHSRRGLSKTEDRPAMIPEIERLRSLVLSSEQKLKSATTDAEREYALIEFRARSSRLRSASCEVGSHCEASCDCHNIRVTKCDGGHHTCMDHANRCELCSSRH